MKYKEYKEICEYEMYRCYKDMRSAVKVSRFNDLKFFERLRIKYFQPNSNCVYLCRKMWYYQSKNSSIYKIRAKMVYLKIHHKYGCCIFPTAVVEKGFLIKHAVGIVIGNCTIGSNFTIFQNCVVGSKYFDPQKNYGNHPQIGNNVVLSCQSSILGGVHICDNVIIGAHSLVLHDISQTGTYIGIPVKSSVRDV